MLGLVFGVVKLGLVLVLLFDAALLLTAWLGDALPGRDPTTDARTAASLGMDENPVWTLGPAADCAASARPNEAEVMKAKAETATTTAGLTTCALTCEPRLGPGLD